MNHDHEDGEGHEVMDVYGTPVHHHTHTTPDGNHIHHFGIPKDFRIPPGVKARWEHSLTAVLDSAYEMAGDTHEDAAFVAMAVSLGELWNADPAKAAMMFAYTLLTTAKLRAQAREADAALFALGATESPPEPPAGADPDTRPSGRYWEW